MTTPAPAPPRSARAIGRKSGDWADAAGPGVVRRGPPARLAGNQEGNRAGVAGGRTGPPTRGGGCRRPPHRAGVVRRRCARVRRGRAGPLAPRPRRPAGRRGAALGQAALAGTGRAAASALPLRHGGRIQDAVRDAVAAQVGAARGRVGLASALPEDPAAARRRRRAGDDRRPAARAHPAARRSGARAADLQAGLRSAARHALAAAVLRPGAGAGRHAQAVAPRPVVRGRRGQLDRRRGALSGRARSPAAGFVADRRGGAAAARQTARDRPARG